MGKKLIFHYDGGHAWLEVSMSELDRLGIADKISAYSYKRGNKVYLEKDCDAGHYIKAIGTYAIAEVNDGDFSPIRNFERYR